MVRSLYTFLIVIFCFLNLSAQDCDLHPPVNLAVSNITATSATFSWQPGGATVLKYKVFYRLTGTTAWSNKINVGTNTSYTFTNLQPNTGYDFSVIAKCTDGSTSKRKKISATTLPDHPNIVFILIDDSRSDYFSCNGAFPFFHTPHIDQIANEGVNFKKTYCITSLCAPSRASIATGLFTTKTGVYANELFLDSSFTTIPKVFKQNGYYTALVGKNHNTFLNGEIPEFNYWLWSLAPKMDDQTKFNYNGTIKYIIKPNVETLTDTAIAIINRVNNQPLLLWLAYRCPHHPEYPLPQYIGKYDDEVLPWPADTTPYKKNYPSFLYNRGPGFILTGEDLDTTYRNVLEVISGLDSCVGKVVDALQNTGKLDNTLLIFMSDNGFMIGSHWLNEKTMAYEPSMRLPLFIRYPAWFTPGSEVTDLLALNLDIAPTMYEAAGINYTEPLDGHSLRDLYNGTFNRTQFYYYMLHDTSSTAPSKRAIRDMQYKYIHYSCNSDTTEEFFDEVNDPLELTNLINASSYQSLIQVYRNRYDSMRAVWNDLDDNPKKKCHIKSPLVTRQLIDDDEEGAMDFTIYPNPSAGRITVDYVDGISGNVEFTIYDGMGKSVFTEVEKSEMGISNIYDFGLQDLPSGIYMLEAKQSDEVVQRKFVVVR